jgi:hypothetical protein
MENTLCKDLLMTKTICKNLIFGFGVLLNKRRNEADLINHTRKK